MSAAIVDLLTIALVPMGMLPVVTALVLLPHVNSESTALKERARLSIVLAFLGLVVTAVALNRLLNLGISGAWVAIPFGVALLLVDAASGMWLFQYVRGRFKAH